MPGETTTEYEISFSPTDRLLVRFKTRSRSGGRAEILGFSIVYRAQIGKRWRTIRRYDDAHGPPHMHQFDWRAETANIRLGNREDASEVFNNAIRTLKRDYQKIRTWFIESK